MGGGGRHRPRAHEGQPPRDTCPRVPRDLWVWRPCARVCVHVCRRACLGACMCTSEGPLSRSCLAGCGVTLGCKRPSPPSGPELLTQVLPFIDPSVHASGAYVDRQIDGQMHARRATLSFLPRSCPSSWAPGWGPSSPQWSLSLSHGARRGLQQ